MAGGHSLPDWAAILGPDMERFAEALAAARKGPRVLLATGVGGSLWNAVVDGLLAVALTLRGARVEVLLCDGALRACERATFADTADPEAFAREGASRSWCAACFDPAQAMFTKLGIPVLTYSRLLEAGELRMAGSLAARLPADEIPDFALEGMRVGEHALAGALRYFAKGALDDEPHGERVLRLYFESALRTALAAKRLFATRRYRRASFHHGIYVPQGLVGEAARAAGVPVVNYNPAYRKQCFIFSHGHSYHHTLQAEPVSAWRRIPWSGELDALTRDYLKSRWTGSKDWIWFHEGGVWDREAIAAETGLDLARPTIGLLTNVIWDAQLHYPANAFASMTDWVMRTIDYFAARPDLQLLIRVHPAEIRGTVPTRRRMTDEIAARFPVLPPNVGVIPPESGVSTYVAMGACNAVAIYGTKAGVELAAMGMPVIVAGEAWIRGKGLTMDASAPEEYVACLDRLPLPRGLDKRTAARAMKYAFHFFFRRMIPVGAIVPAPGWPPFALNVAGLDDLAPGRDPGLDVITRGILRGTPFIHPLERLMDAAAPAKDAP